MIKSITVTNYRGESIKLELRRPDLSGMYVEKIEGLGPSKANINITERATIDGAYYTSAHTTARNIVITLGFVFSHNIEEVRHKSYKYFPLKKRVNLVIETDTRTCETYGYVESNEPDIFSENEKTQISIVCPDPYFYSVGSGSTTVTVFSGTESLFEFPFSSELATDSDDSSGDSGDDSGETSGYTFPTAEPGVYEHGSNFTKMLYAWDDIYDKEFDGCYSLYDEKGGGDQLSGCVGGDIIIPTDARGGYEYPVSYIYDLCCGDIVLPENVTYISDLLDFKHPYGGEPNSEIDCHLETIYVKATTPPGLSNAFTSTHWDGNVRAPYLTKIVVPKGCGDAYRSATNWSTLADIIVEEGETLI